MRFRSKPIVNEEAVLLTLALIACQPTLLEGEDGGLRQLTGIVTTRNNGFVTVDVDVEDETTMLITAQVVESGDLVHIRRLFDPDGAIVYDATDWFSPADEQKTNAAFLAPVSSLNWPVADSDPPLTPGRWSALIGLTDSEREFVKRDVDVDIRLKRDDDLATGRLKVNLVRQDDADPGLTVALDQAKNIWRDLYADIGIDIEFEDWVTSDDLAPPTAGDPGFIDLARTVMQPSVVVSLVPVIDTDLLDIDSGTQIVGISGGIPGAQVPSLRSGVQVGTLTSAGTNGIFEGFEITQLAETLAHETAHYLGLFHPVEALVGERPWSVYDALQDTPRCRNENGCINNLGNNLMFPFALCDPSDPGNCIPQQTLSDDQVGVVHRYTGVR